MQREQRMNSISAMNGTQLRALIVGLERLGSSSKPCFWSAVAQMHGASLHRSYRFRTSRDAREVASLRVPGSACCRGANGRRKPSCLRKR